MRVLWGAIYILGSVWLTGIGLSLAGSPIIRLGLS